MKRNWKFLCLLPVALMPLWAAACDDSPNERVTRAKGLIVDPDSDARLASLNLKLAEGTFVYRKNFVDVDDASTLEVASTTVVIAAPIPGQRQISFGSQTVVTDERGNFIGSSDPSASSALTAGYQLPADATRGHVFSDVGLPFTQAHVDAANASGVGAESIKTFSYSVGTTAVDDDAFIYIVKRDLYDYVLPTSMAQDDAANFEAIGVDDFSPGMKSKPSGAAWDYYLVDASTHEALKIAEAYVSFSRIAEPPSDVSSVFDGTFPNVVPIYTSLDVAQSSIPASLADDVAAAQALLDTSTPQMLFADQLVDSALAPSYFDEQVVEPICVDEGSGGMGSGGMGSGGMGRGGDPGSGGFGMGGSGADVNTGGSGGFGGMGGAGASTPTGGSGGFGGSGGSGGFDATGGFGGSGGFGASGGSGGIGAAIPTGGSGGFGTL